MPAANAAPVVQASSSSYTVGQTVTFSVHDNAVQDGQDAGYYLADISFTWDPLLFSIAPQPLTLSSTVAGLAFASVGADGFGGAPDATNTGNYLVSMLTDPPAASGDVELFSLNFVALKPSTSATLGVGPMNGGSYGPTGNTFGGSSSGPITLLPGAAIPEPGAWALSGLALLAAFSARRRR